MIAVHISNRHLDLQPVVWQLAQEYSLDMVRVSRPARAGDDGYPSEWVLLTHDRDLLEIPAIASHSQRYDGYQTSIRLWTDDYSNLFQILR